MDFTLKSQVRKKKWQQMSSVFTGAKELFPCGNHRSLHSRGEHVVRFLTLASWMSDEGWVKDAKTRG